MRWSSPKTRIHGGCVHEKSRATTILLFVGCAHQLQFRVVEFPSGKVLPGVNVKIEDRGQFSYFYRKRHEKEIGSTNAEGFIIVSGVKTKHVIFFDAPDYRGAAAGLEGGGKIRISWSISPLTTEWVPSRLIVTNSNEVIVIPLVPR
jgi:hypothetical protein